MCGRFQLSVKGKQISERFNVEVFDELYKPSYNCSPSQKLPIITNEHPEKLSFYNWGLIPFWAKDPKIGMRNINTRVETIGEKPSFKNAFKKRRCIIPANGFYEWKKDANKTPFRFYLKNEELFAFAGIWEKWKDAENKEYNTFSIITTSANKVVSGIHNRMPVILNPEFELTWLTEKNEQNLLNMLAPFNPNKMDTYIISKEVNSPLNNSPEIIIKADDGQTTLF
jgi:putative SOS response-associated peptidase YedK